MNFDLFLNSLQREGFLYLNIKVIPNAKKTEAVEMMKGPEEEEIIKIKVAAPPEKGKANAALQKYLAQVFGVSKNQVTITHGQTSPRKLIKILLPPKAA